MEGILEKLGWKKVAALLIIVSFFGLVFVYTSLTEADKTALLNKKNAQNPESNTGNTNFEITKTPQQKRSENLAKSFTAPFYKVSYPQNFDAILYEPSGNVVSNVRLKDKITGKQIEIVVFSAGPFTFESLAKPYELASYTKTEFNANSLSGFEFINTEKKIKINERVAIISKGAVMIRLQLTYDGAKNEALEAQFDTIIQTIE